MGCYLFQNGSVYARMEGAVTCLLWDEFVASPMVQDKNAHILIAEGDGPLFMEHVRRIRQAFPKSGIKTCVPYALALRTFLQTRGLVAMGENCLVADDLGDKFLLTASNGRQTAVTRAILSLSPAKIVEEIRRTQKSEPVLRILSNNAQVIGSLDPERKKEAKFFETSFPAFEVLGKVRFSVALMSPEELVIHKKSALRRGLIAACGMSLLMAAAGAACFSCARVKENEMSRKVDGLMIDKAGLEREERELSMATYQEQLKALPKINFFEVLAPFTECFPTDGRTEHVLMDRGPDMRWRFTGLVSFPRHEILPFACNDILKEVRVEHVFIQTRPGVKVTLMLPDERKGGALR